MTPRDLVAIERRHDQHARDVAELVREVRLLRLALIEAEEERARAAALIGRMVASPYDASAWAEAAELAGRVIGSPTERGEQQ